MAANAQEGTDDEPIFSPLVGHDGAKAILRSSVLRGDVHLLLSGPPASGKSVALLAIEDAVDGAEYVDARGFTERKLRDTLAENPPVLLVDEFDNMKPDAFKALNTALEQGRVTKSVTNESYDINIDTQVFAACNYPEDLPGDVVDRFISVDFDPYSEDEYLDVCAVLLPRQVEWVANERNPQTTARTIASIVWEHTDSKSPRTARDAARLAADAGRVRAIVRAMNDAKADVDSEPVRPHELPHNQDDDQQSREPNRPDDVPQSMVDPDEIESRDMDEIQSIIDSAADDDESTQTGTDDGDTTSATGDTDKLDDEGVEDDTADIDIDLGQEYQSGIEYIRAMKDADQQMMGNSFDQTGFSIIFPKEVTDDIMSLVKRYKLSPGANDVMTWKATELQENFDGDWTDDLLEVQFIADDPQDVNSTGYNIPKIVETLAGQDVLFTKSSTLRWSPDL